MAGVPRDVVDCVMVLRAQDGFVQSTLGCPFAPLGRCAFDSDANRDLRAGRALCPRR